jgi:hypothetical protein
MEPQFVDLLIRLGAAPAQGAAYPVEAVVDGDAQYYGGLLELDRAALLVEILDVRAYGARLGEALFSTPIQRAYDRARARAEERSEGRLRLRLQIDPDASELQAIHWERLMLSHRGLALPAAATLETPFSRYIALEESPPPPLSERPLSLLIAIANPTGLAAWGLAPIDVEREIRGLWEALADLANPATLSLTILPGRGGLPPALTRSLEGQGCRILAGATGSGGLTEAMRQFHLLHLIAHGAFRPGQNGRSGHTRLFLEAPDGSAELAHDDDLVARWAAASPLPRLIYLAACETGVRGDAETEPFVGLGPKLVAAGVPAVVAMQDQVPIEFSGAFTRRFFQALLTHGAVDRALNEARWLLLEGRSPDWSIPVLYMRLEAGRLLAPDPLRESLEAMIAWSRDSLSQTEPPLPIEAVRAPAGVDAAALRRLEQTTEAGYELAQAARELLLAPAPSVQPFTVLLGGEGTGKSVYLRMLVGQLAEESLSGGAERRWVPLLLDPSAEPVERAGSGLARSSGLEAILSGALRRFWPDLTLRHFRELWTDPSGPVFLVLVDNADSLTEAGRAALFRDLSALALRARRHRFLVVCSASWIHQGRAADLPVTDYLVVKRMSFQRVESWLSALAEPAGEELRAALRDRRLFDLAGLPWLVVHMLARTRLGEPPRSRRAVLAGFVEGALASLPSRRGIRGRALESLRLLALELQLGRQRVLSLERTLEILDRVRGKREYRLLEMLDALTEARMLMRIGQDQLQFSYAPLQAYCSADAIRGSPNFATLADDITATLGRLSRLRWWADTLVLLSGMIDDVDTLISLILQGAGIGQEERVFLAARCIEENVVTILSPFLREQTVAALLHLTNVDYEPRVRVRVRAIRSLQRLQETSAIPQLARIAMEPVRKGWKGNHLPEYSFVRLAAVAALRTMGQPAKTYVHAEHPRLAELMDLWMDADVPAIVRRLQDEDALVGSIAAFLLGLLRLPEADDRLIEQFMRPDQDGLLSWALSDALTMIDPGRVAREAILPFIHPGSGVPLALPGESRAGQRIRRRQFAYLIGKVKPRSPCAQLYLDRCISELTDVALKGYAIRAFGDLMETGQKRLLERLAIGDFTGVAVGRRWSDADRHWLRQAAVETLAEIGDIDSVHRLRRERRPDQPWTPELELALFRTGEEIAARALEVEG